ncbi:glycoside hydrolase family 3 N-terminal domain-containing protein [Streptococcus suis]
MSILAFLPLLYLLNKRDGQSINSPSFVTVQEISVKDKRVSDYLRQMTLEEKVGQMIFARMPSAGQAEALETYHFGGYILFSRDYEGKNLEQVKEEIASYQAQSKVPLLITSDEEGGTVTRISQLLETPYDG